jgi:hypothetical protein
MRGLCKVFLTLAVVAVMAMPALAQQRQRQGQGQGRGGPGMFGGGGIGMLAQNKSVQEEIKLTDDQATKVKDYGTKAGEKAREEFQKLQDVPQEERREKMQAMMKTANEEAEKELGGILKPEQMKRLKQISLQQRGAQAVNDPEIEKALKLTDKQKEDVKTITTESQKALQELRPPPGQGGGGAPNPETQKKIQDLRKDTNEKVVSVLHDDQKKTWKELTGTPFEVKREPRRQQ